jgi:hypothetical protein
LHYLHGARFVNQLKLITYYGDFHPIEGETGIFSTGGEGSEDYANLLDAARKAVEHGYRVFILPNPRETRTADFIFEKKRTYRMYDLKTAFGKASIGQNLLDSIGQCNRVLINMTTGYKTRSLAFAIKKYFEVNSKAVEILIFKGRKRISIDRFIATNDDFFSIFKKSYER